MRLLQTAVAVLVLLFAVGCAHQPPAKPAAAATPSSGPAPIVPPLTTYGCDPLLAMRLGRSC